MCFSMGIIVVSYEDVKKKTYEINGDSCYFIHENGGTPRMIRNFPENKYCYIYNNIEEDEFKFAYNHTINMMNFI